MYNQIAAFLTITINYILSFLCYLLAVSNNKKAEPLFRDPAFSLSRLLDIRMLEQQLPDIYQE